MKHYDVVVVGGGVSGLLSALVLSKHGKSVCVLEKDKIGGVCRSYDVEGDSGLYRVDTGPHIITRLDRGPLKKLMENYIDIPPQFVPHGDYYVRLGGKLERLPWAIKDFLTYDVIPIKDRLLLISSFPRLFYTDEDISVIDFVAPYGLSENSQKFIDAFCYFLTGLSAKETPVSRIADTQKYKDDSKNIFVRMKNALLAGKRTDQYYPLGGIQVITDSILANFSGDLFEGEAYRVFNIQDGKVETKEEEFSCDFVVYSGFMRELPELVELQKEYSASLSTLKSVKALTMWIGTRENLFPNLGSEVWIDTSKYCWAVPTSNYDPSLAPEGCQLAGLLFAPGVVENQAKNTFYEVFPDTSLDMLHFQHLIPEKAAWSLEEFPSTKPPLDNLYLVGTDTEKKSMGLTRASYSVINLIDVLKKEGRI
jgi:phytoene dehydrogenase-like protein